MSIEVILREHVEHLGNRGEIVKVADGYARNYLFPRKLALAVTDENKRQIERERAKAEAREAEELRAAEALAPRLEAVDPSRAASARTTRCTARSRPPTSPMRSPPASCRSITGDPARRSAQGARRAHGAVKLHRDLTAHVKVKIVPAESGGRSVKFEVRSQRFEVIDIRRGGGEEPLTSGFEL